MAPEGIKKQIELWDKNAPDIQILQSGSTNIIGLTDSAVYRFPLNEDALSIQLYEAEIYKKLDNRLDVPTPQLLKIHDEPPCIVITRLQGTHLSTDDLTNLNDDSLRSFIRQLIEFSVSLNKAITIEEIKTLESTHISSNLYERSWVGYLSHYLKDARFPANQWLEDFAHEQYKKWFTKVSSSRLPAIVVHDDLHDANILFEDTKISGILDFGDSTVGTIAQEFRQLYRIHESAVHIAVEEYERMASVSIDPDEITTWAVTQELASYCRWYAKDELGHASFIRAKSNLNRWLNNFQG